MHATCYDDLPTPIGRLRLVADAQGLCEMWFERECQEREIPPAWVHSPSALADARVQLEQYFAGTRKTFELPLHPAGTSFQLGVWAELVRIPYGATISYGELAQRIGQPRAVRAVGGANGRNPLPIVVPCHRVIGANGGLTGFGGGLPIKRFLLTLEDAVARGDLFGAVPAQRAAD